MSFFHKITTVGRNKVFLYVSSRYLTYGLQFVNSIILAVVLYEYFPVYGYLLIVLQYIALCNLGVPYSLNVFLSLNKENGGRMESLLSTSFFIYLFLFLFLCSFFYILPLFGIQIGAKYQFEKYVFFVVLIGLLAHLNTLMSNYFRVKNRLGEIVFLQSVIPLFVFIVSFFVKGKVLLDIILWVMLLGNLVALFVFLKNSQIKSWIPRFSLIRPILKKAFFLFLYNTFFYLILLSIRTIVSDQYSVSDFALFTFSFTLANSIILLFDSFSFLVYPKTIHRLNKADTSEVLRIMEVIKVNYITSIHFVMYFFVILYPFFVSFFPQYITTFKCFSLITMTIVLYSNCFAYSSYLTAKNKEKLISGLAFFALITNVLLALYLIFILNVSYEYVILSTMISYIIYNFILVFFAFRLLKIKMVYLSVVVSIFPVRLFFPFAILLGFVLFDAPAVVFVFVLVLFILLNKTQLLGILKTMTRILKDSSIINI